MNKENEKNNEKEITKIESITSLKQSEKWSWKIENNNILENYTNNLELQKFQNNKSNPNLLDLLRNLILNKLNKISQLYLHILNSKKIQIVNNLK